MSTPSAEVRPVARNVSQALLQALARMPLDAIAEAVNKDESTACRIRTGEARLTLQEFCALVDAAGKKLVGKDRVCVHADKFNAVMLLLTSTLSDEDTVTRALRQGDE